MNETASLSPGVGVFGMESNPGHPSSLKCLEHVEGAHGCPGSVFLCYKCALLGRRLGRCSCWNSSTGHTCSGRNGKGENRKSRAQEAWQQMKDGDDDGWVWARACPCCLR